MGTPEFARVALSSLWNDGYPLLGVVAQPDKPQGRGQSVVSPPCALFAKEKNIPLFQPVSIKEEAIIRSIENLKPDFIVVVAYGKLLPPRILKIPRLDIINIHASLLPKYRGAAPIQWAILNGERETGISIMRLTEKMDAGPVYLQKHLLIEEKDTAQRLSDKLKILGAEALLEAIPLIQNKQVEPKPQDDSLVTYARPLKKEDGRISWNGTAETLLQKIKGLNPWPMAFTSIDNKTLKIYDAEILPDKVSNAPGTIYFLSEKGIHVACQNSAICLTRVQLEGRKKMSSGDFIRGFRLQAGNILE